MDAGRLPAYPRRVVFKQLFPFNRKNGGELCRCAQARRVGGELGLEFRQGMSPQCRQGGIDAGEHVQPIRRRIVVRKVGLDEQPVGRQERGHFPVVDGMVVQERRPHGNEAVQGHDVRQESRAARKAVEQKRGDASAVRQACLDHLAPALRAVQHHGTAKRRRQLKLSREGLPLAIRNRARPQAVKPDLAHAQAGIGRKGVRQGRQARGGIRFVRLPGMHAHEPHFPPGFPQKGFVLAPMEMRV